MSTRALRAAPHASPGREAGPRATRARSATQPTVEPPPVADVRAHAPLVADDSSPNNNSISLLKDFQPPRLSGRARSKALPFEPYQGRSRTAVPSMPPPPARCPLRKSATSSSSQSTTTTTSEETNEPRAAAEPVLSGTIEPIDLDENVLLVERARPVRPTQGCSLSSGNSHTLLPVAQPGSAPPGSSLTPGSALPSTGGSHEISNSAHAEDPYVSLLHELTPGSALSSGCALSGRSHTVHSTQNKITASPAAADLPTILDYISFINELPPPTRTRAQLYDPSLADARSTDAPSAGRVSATAAAINSAHMPHANAAVAAQAAKPVAVPRSPRPDGQPEPPLVVEALAVRLRAPGPSTALTRPQSPTACAISAVSSAALSTIAGAAGSSLAPTGECEKRTRRPPVLPRGSVFESKKDERLARKQVFAKELAQRFSPRMYLALLGEDGLIQVPCASDRAEAVARILMSLGGPDGNGLRDATKALDVLAAHARHTAAADPYCLPVSGLLAHSLVAREYKLGLENGAGHSLGGASRGHSFRQGLTWLRDHLRLPICLDAALLEAAAPKTSEIEGSGKKKAGTFPLQIVCLFELVAAAVRPDLPREDSVTVHFARSFLAFAILGSLRVQDLEEIDAVLLDQFDPDTVVSAHVRLSKNGEPIELFVPAEGFLGPLSWWPRHRESCRRIGAFPLHQRPFGSGGALAKSPAFEPRGRMTGAQIRAGMKEVASMKPLDLSPADVAALLLQGHSAHGTLNDYFKCIGRWPSLFGEHEEGFSKHDRDAVGHWLSFGATDAEVEPPPPPKRRRDGQAPDREHAGSDRSHMRERYARGEGRGGERAEQLRIRRRGISFIRRAIEAWSRHWGVSWMRLPAGHASKLVLSEQRATVVPSSGPWPQPTAALA
jgi:hypothetical protein